jgi:prophage antirepressor-like protein
MGSSAVEVFKFEGNEIRTHIDESGNSWWSVKDVCEVLCIKYHRDATSRLVGNVTRRVIVDAEEITAVSEPGLYQLVLKSKKPNALKFQDWITSEVLPSIRKTGAYSVVPKEELSPLDILENHVRHMRRLESSNQRLSEEIKVVAIEAKQENDTLTYDQIMDLGNLISSIKRVSKDPKDSSRAMRMIKARFNLTGMNTWKETPRYGFNEAKLLVSSFKASLKDHQTELEF